MSKAFQTAAHVAVLCLLIVGLATSISAQGKGQAEEMVVVEVVAVVSRLAQELIAD